MPGPLSDDLAGFVRQIRRLADDIERIADGRGPGDLAAAPLLSEWRPMVVPATERALVGIVRGHPLIANGRRTVTSAITAIDPGLGWVRTWNRFYRLAAPADAVGHDAGANRSGRLP